MTLLARQPTPDYLDAVTKLVVDSVKSPHTKRSYADAISQFLAWGAVQGIPSSRMLRKDTATSYIDHMRTSGRSAATINIHLGAIRKLAREAGDNGYLGNNSEQIIGAIGRIKPERRLGIRTGQWLTAEQANRLLSEPDQSKLKGKRDVAIFSILLGMGLRRAELCCLTKEHIQQRDGRWVVLNIVGKGNRPRTIAMPNWVKVSVDAWVVAKERAIEEQGEKNPEGSFGTGSHPILERPIDNQ